MRARPPRSLRSRALQLLAQRDQSRLELRRKLLRHARLEAAKAQALNAAPGSAADAEIDAGAGADAVEPAAEVEAALDWLDAQGFLSDARFAESRVHARQSRFGNLRIGNELAQHGVALAPATAEALAASELERAATVRERRFASPPEDAAGRAAQSRFLAGRGFSPEVIHRLMRRLAGRERVD